MVPKSVQTIVKIRSVFGFLFLGFGALPVPLGSLPGPSEAGLDGLGLQNSSKKHMLVRILANAGFRCFDEALDGPPGPILVPLGPIWFQNGSQSGPQKVVHVP